MVVFAYAPAGLGHLRVTQALYEGLENRYRAILLGSNDTNITTLHRIMSINPVIRSGMEWMQHGTPQDVFTYCYRTYLQSHNGEIYKQLKILIKQQMVKPKNIYVIATHFGLAHQIASIKNKFFIETGIPIRLIVQITDDSPQHIWLIPGADMLVAPSHSTKEALEKYATTLKIPLVPITVLPYPVSPKLSEDLGERYELRLKQTDPNIVDPINISVPISGAATGTLFLQDLMSQVIALIRRVRFYTVLKDALYTKQFVSFITPYSQITKIMSNSDRELVRVYEELYENTTITFEITKPSEQAFKALLKPFHVGGSILLFITPIGRQEYDNINFLIRHYLIPSQEENVQLWELAKLQSLISPELLEKSHTWRGIRLPETGTAASQFIMWGLNQGLFTSMLKFELSPMAERCKDEIASDGVARFWEHVGMI